MVRAYSIIANGGNDVKLTLTQKDNVDMEDIEIISAEMSSRLKKLLINVVEGENGTGKSLRKEGYIIGGNTESFGVVGSSLYLVRCRCGNKKLTRESLSRVFHRSNSIFSTCR